MAVTLTVSQVNFFIRSLLEGDGRLNDILVTGEISNFTDHYRSGHLYFSLKDDKSVLKAVMFAGSAKRLRFRLDNGMKVIVRGRVSVYEPSGQYQLYAEDIQPDGVGALALAFEQLKEKLAAQGLFDSDRKRSLPPFPERIGVITSPTGAAIRDILQVTARRWPVAQIVFCPVTVQGDGAAGQITAAVKEMDRKNACDVLIVGRGGGSIEDLWAFNDEELARAVAVCRIPVVSAVGHETDYTICDFAADLRAPTPSAAAELCTPDIREEKKRLAALNDYFTDQAKDMVAYLRQSLDLLTQDSPLENFQRILDPWRRKLDDLSDKTARAFRGGLERKEQRLALLSGNLDALSPLKVLSRGYSVTADPQGRVIRDVSQIETGDRVLLRFHTGRAKAEIVEKEEG